MSTIEFIVIIVVALILLPFLYSLLTLSIYTKKMFGNDENFNFSEKDVFVEKNCEFNSFNKEGCAKKEFTYSVYVNILGKKQLVKRFFDKKRAENCRLSLIKKGGK